MTQDMLIAAAIVTVVMLLLAVALIRLIIAWVDFVENRGWPYFLCFLPMVAIFYGMVLLLMMEPPQ